MEIERLLADSLHTGFIDASYNSREEYQPQLLINDSNRGRKVLSSILSELEDCQEFLFSVAFITQGGVTVLLNALSELHTRGVKGKILTSSYQNFTDPRALQRLMLFDNLQIKILTDANHHAKGYYFRKRETDVAIIGSSNLTQDALTKNNEWNLKITSIESGKVVREILAEFETDFNRAQWVDEGWLAGYQEYYSQIQRKPYFVVPDYGRRPVFEVIPPQMESLGQGSGSFDVHGIDVSTHHLEYDAQKAKLDYPSVDHVAERRSMLQTVHPNKMQERALENLKKLRESGENKALLVSATGTGKTYLSAFDVQQMRAEKVLFLIHRETIAKEARKAFKQILGNENRLGKKKRYGLLTGHHSDYDADYLFATVQTVSKFDVLNRLKPDQFDYIIIDESHRAGAKTYQRILKHFTPKFLLGMTATPERTDGHNICGDFDYNIAYEIRLQEAMKEDMLCPFHYFGISEIAVDGKVIEETSEFRNLVSEQRVNHIIEKIAYYGHSGEKVRGLVFCSRNEEARELSERFNRRGFRTVALSGSSSQQEREDAIQRLESKDSYEALDYIFSVDIFNEGVDIPTLNQIVMLRPTQSAIIFVQQLGRGLRKVSEKEFVVVLDFIGNYSNNFMIPMALSDDRSYNKDTIRKFVVEGSRVLPGCSTINFDAISRKRIFESIDRVNFNSVEYMKESYRNLKFRLGRIPTMMDYERHDSMDMARVFENRTLGSYYKFLTKYEDEYEVRLSELQDLYIEFISRKIAVGKRPHELLVLQALLMKNDNPLDYMTEVLQSDFGIDVTSKTLTNVTQVLSQQFPAGSGRETYAGCKILTPEAGGASAEPNFLRELEDEQFHSWVQELTELGLYRYKTYYGEPYERTALHLYQKYTYEDVCRLLEWEKAEVPQNIGGYKYDDKSKTYPIFINYNKADDVHDTINYEDRFLSPTHLVAISKSKRKKSSPDVVTAFNAKELGVRMELFVRKNKDDMTSKEFYYLGRMNAVGDLKEFVMKGTNSTAVEIQYQLKTPVREDLYEYITKI